MKNLVIILLMLSVCSLTSCNKTNPPENVKKEFAQKFAAAKSVKWDSEKPNEWEAEFKMNGKEMSACFDDSGKWLETETEVSAKELPDAVANTLKKDFAGYTADEISIVENPEVKGYEIALKNKEDEITVVIGANGIVLEKEAAGESVENESAEKAENKTTEADEVGEAEAPENVVKAFNLKFPGANSIEWGSETANEWEVEFSMDGKKMSSCFDTLGAWIESETEISEKDLPSAVLNTLKTEYPGYRKTLIEIFDSPEIKGFELGLKKGEISTEVIFDNSGKVIKKTVSEENNEEAEKDEKAEK